MSQPNIPEKSLDIEKTSLKLRIATLITILSAVIMGTFYVVTFASDNKHDIQSLKSDKLETDTFYNFKKSQEYNQRELFKSNKIINKKLDLLLRKNKIRFNDFEIDADSSEFNGE